LGNVKRVSRPPKWQQQIIDGLDPGLEAEWPIWRLIFEEVATKEELERFPGAWTFKEISKANALLDMRAAIIENQPKPESGK